MELFNLTRFVADRFIAMDGAGLERLLVVVKATYQMTGRAPRLADQQLPIVMADEFAGEPDDSSVILASDIAPEKPSADYTVAGCAYPSGGKAAGEALVAAQVGPLRKGAVVSGERAWVKSFGSVSVTKPAPFSRMPLVWERAFGGKDDTGKRPEWWPENPVGIAFRSKGSQAPIQGARLPNVEDPTARMASPDDRCRSIGFGPIPPSWSPRPTFAGTHDKRWERERMPLPPHDFDPRFHHAVAADQIFPGYLRGGEPVILTGVRPEGGYSFALPRLAPQITVRIADQEETPAVRCDTVHFDCEEQRLTLVARAHLVVQGRVNRLRWITVDDSEHGVD